MTELTNFSAQERKRFSGWLARQSRGAVWFFALIALVVVVMAITVLMGIVPLADDVNAGFMGTMAIIVIFFCGVLGYFFFDHRSRIDRVLQKGYRLIEVQIVSISERSENGRSVRFEYSDATGVVTVGGQPFSGGEVGAAVGDKLSVFLLADNLSFFAETLDTCMAVGKFEKPIHIGNQTTNPGVA